MTLICPPDHLHGFSASGLALAVERAGFDVVLAAPFFERTVPRWIARRDRNLAVAARGLVVRALAKERWSREHEPPGMPADDIRFVVARNR